MQEQKTVILSTHNQNSPSIPICCPALRYKNNEALDSDLQIIGSYDQLDNNISSVMSVYSYLCFLGELCWLHGYLSHGLKVWV